MLPIPFGILTVCGFWRPVSLKSPLAKTAYDLYSGLMFVLIWSFTLSHLIDIAITAESFESLTGSCFMLLSMLNVCCKMTNILYFRGDILDLLAILAADRCKARDDRELELQEKFHSRAKFVALCYGGLTETTCALITLRTFFGAASRALPFKAWMPYDAGASPAGYWLTFAHQTVAHCGAANLQIANETLVCGLMIQACSQLELLKLRLASLGPESDKTDDGGDGASSRRLIVETFEHHRKITE
ncbi:unnamed protein product [Trichogramma brassicae]|uniref:Odorant receptor n=1 Tax=Trichogramma brassicae TaxID=86971 RepID=A0A6H5IG45_9HYME|nr:unnamed protein product [Trichogramma brassicae]